MIANRNCGSVSEDSLHMTSMPTAFSKIWLYLFSLIVDAECWKVGRSHDHFQEDVEIAAL
uniref:Uncharacterized protein n=1 Tax=Megaselia scalaris TaxID=36166 RepID=T1GAY0_MEGSC